MNMINKRLEELIEKYKITKTSNIIFGTNYIKPKLIIPTPWKPYIKYTNLETYFLFFDTLGIIIYKTDTTLYKKISWQDVTYFKVKKVLAAGNITIKTKTDTYKFQINRCVLASHKIRENTRYIEENNYFYNQ